MKHFVLIFIIFLLATTDAVSTIRVIRENVECPSNPSTNPSGPSPSSDPRFCGRPAPLGNLICYVNDQKIGFNYAFITFDDAIVALASIRLDCQAGTAATLDVLVVYGFMFNLSDKTTQKPELWYVNFGVRGCPSVKRIVNYVYDNRNGQFNDALYPTTVETNLAYEMYQELVVRDVYRAQCNVFRSVSVDGDSAVARISLDGVRSTLFYNANPLSNGSAIKYIRDYGIRGIRCTAPESVEGYLPPVGREICTSDGYDNCPYCRNFQNSPQLDEIAKSYGYNVNSENLSVFDVCKLATLWTQGYLCKSGNNYGYPSCPRSNPGGGTFTYAGIAIIPNARNFINFKTPAFPDSVILYIIIKGYCPVSTKEAIMQNFVNAC